MPPRPSIVVVDDFLPDPDTVRRVGLAQNFQPSDYHKGRRSAQRFLTVVDPQDFARLLQLEKIDDWGRHWMNARFQFCTPADPIVYHSDGQRWAAALYLTPDPPPATGTSFYRSRATGARTPPTDPRLLSATFDGKLLDPNAWEEIDRVGNRYNRLVLWNAQLIHSATGYFGSGPEDARLFLIFFFDGD